MLETKTRMQYFRRAPKRFVARLVVGATIFVVGAMVIASGIGRAEDTGASKSKTDGDSKLQSHALVTWFDVGSPLGTFLLIRKRANVCAIKFTEYHRRNDAKAPTVFSSGEESLDAKYECFCHSERGGFGKAKLGEVSKRAPWGIGRFAFGGGDISIRCGEFKLVWMYPTRVSFHTDGNELRDHGIELAPTRWSSIEEVNMSDSRLRWFRLDETRKSTYIPKEDL